MNVKKAWQSNISILSNWLKNVTVPGFRDKSLYHVGRFFVDSLFDEDLMLRASSLAFNFFLALFPSIIFVFTLIAYIPIDQFQSDLLLRIQRILPNNAYELLIGTIDDILNNQNLSLLSFGFVFAIYFSSNAFHSMQSAFNKYVQNSDKRSWFLARWRSIWLTLLVALIVLTIVVFITYVSLSIDWFVDRNQINSSLNYFMIQAVQLVSLFLLVYLVFASLYFYGSAKQLDWSFFSPGSTLATILALVSTLGFKFYVNNFDSYNKLYGSIGAVLVIMLLIYVNCIALLVGFELNSSIDKAEATKQVWSDQLTKES